MKTQTDNTRQPETQNVAGEPAVMDALARFNFPAFEMMRDFNERALAQLAKAHENWMHFMQRRFASDAELAANLARCRTPQEVVRLYAEFFQTAAQHYQQEFADVTRLGQAFGNEATEIVRTTAERVERELRMH